MSPARVLVIPCEEQNLVKFPVASRASRRAPRRLPLVVLTAMIVVTGVAAAVVPAARPVAAATARTTTDLNLRSGASLGATVLLVIPEGASVETLGGAENGFVPVTYAGTRGYAFGQYLTTSSSGTPSDPSTGTATATTDLNLRSGPGLGDGVLRVIPAGANVTVTGDGQNGFLPVTYAGTSGWASRQYLSTGGGSTTPPASAPTGTATATTDLNLRASASTSSAVLAVIPAGGVVTLTGNSQSGFRSVTFNGTAGWAYADYLRTGGSTAPPPTAVATATAAPTQAPSTGTGPTGTYFATTSLNLRATPSTSASVLTVMPSGAGMTLTGQTQNGFSAGVYNNVSGWAYTSFLSSSTPAPSNPTPAPTSPPASGGGGAYTQDQIIAIIYAAADRYGQPRADMLRVARCESNLVPTAVNPAGSYGLFQFIPSTWASTPFSAYDIFDPWASANAAGWMWSVGRRAEWVCQ